MLKDSASRTAEEDFIREVNIMSVFKHINILTLIGILAGTLRLSIYLHTSFIQYEFCQI